MNFKIIIRLFVLFIPLNLLAQTATLKGVILNENAEAVEGVNIRFSGNGTTSDNFGFYRIKIPANDSITLQFSHINYKTITATFLLKNGEQLEFNPQINSEIEQIANVVINANVRQSISGITSIEPRILRTIKGAQPGVENLLKTLPGVSISNELSTQYSVRGGNFDENLVYVNEIEIYRPFLIRSGQQEGLSFVNTDMVRNLEFSAGGFQAKYGDKLASVLDITYRKPTDFKVAADFNLISGSLTLESLSKNSKFSMISGLRYRNNALLVDSRQTESNYNPKFADIQTFLSYDFTEKFNISFLGNSSINNYNYRPLRRQTNFGTIDQPVALLVFYQGQEKDEYATYFGALKANYKFSEKLNLKLISSVYQTTEEEYFDILAQYRLGEVNSNIGDDSLGEVEFSEGIGSQLNHARNNLDALIYNTEHKGNYQTDKDQLQWSLKYSHEDIRDRIVEWEVIDSAGFSIAPPNLNITNNQPYEAHTGPLAPFQNTRKTNNTKIDRIQAYLQWSRRSRLGRNETYTNIGMRVQNWTVSAVDSEKNSQTVLSPRIQFAIKPEWKKDMLFRLSCGYYFQPPFYRELRNFSGELNPKVKAQKSIHLVVAGEYSFNIWERPFKLVSEAYYKQLTDVNPYTINNVRIRYNALNNAKAYAYGLDLRLNGAFVPGTESWFSFSYLKTEENIENQGYISRPTDQRLKFGILFQDYVPKMPNLKMYLNLVYNSGVPGGSPSYASPYNYSSRLPDYKRADLGMSYVIVDAKDSSVKNWKKSFKELSLGFEIYNMFNVQNSITNTWVRDVYSKRQYAVPNYLTPRLFNIRVSMLF